MSEQRLIDAEAFYKQLEEIRAEYIEENTMSSIFAAEIIETVQDSYLEDAPTIDPVRHGEWLFLRETARTITYSCSECCVAETTRRGRILKFCPNCGAKMDKE